MAMNLRLGDDRTEAVKHQAELEQRSMHAIVLRAVDEYLAQNARESVVREVASQEAAKWQELMERLK